MADLGWIAGHSSVVYGPLCNGGTTVLFESVATYPDCGMYTQPSYLNLDHVPVIKYWTLLILSLTSRAVLGDD